MGLERRRRIRKVEAMELTGFDDHLEIKEKGNKGDKKKVHL